VLLLYKIDLGAGNGRLLVLVLVLFENRNDPISNKDGDVIMSGLNYSSKYENA